MEVFQADGHLTEGALRALAGDAALPELQRLEIAEHLAYCDDCLLRYTALLSEERLEVPPLSCMAALRRRIRARSARIFASRWTTAAAAIAIAVTLWITGTFGGMVTASQTLTRDYPSTFGESVLSWPETWSQSLSQQFSRLDHMFDFFGGDEQSPPATTQGGTHS